MVCHPAPLAIGHVRKGNERGRVRDGVGLLDGVADCVDVRIVGLVRLIDGDAATRPELEPGKLGEPDVGPDADGSDDEIRGEDAPIGQGHRAFADGRDGRPRLHAHAVGDELVADENRKLGVERWEHLRRRLDDGDGNTLTDEVLGHLEPDESGPDHDGGRRRDADVGGEPRRVLQLLKCATCCNPTWLPAQPHPSGRPTTGQDTWGSGTRAGTSHGTVGALAQGMALHAARGSWRNIR